MKQLGMVLAFMLILMPMIALASDRISEDLNLQKDLNLKSFDFEPKHVKVDGSGQTVNFLATIYANNGLLDNKSAGFATQATFLGPRSFSHPFYRDSMNVAFLPTPILGNKKNGSYRGTMTLPSGMEEGVWQLDSIKLVDSNGSVRELKGDDLGSLPKELDVEGGFLRWGLILVFIPVLIPILLILFIFVVILHKTLDWKTPESIAKIWKGYDGATSSSKFQFFLWTLVVLYAYTIIVVDAYYNHSSIQLGLSIPQNLILAMGLSATTMLAAKGITSKYADTDEVNKSNNGKGGLFLDDGGFPDLAKIQLMSWTFIGIGIFLLKTLNGIIGTTEALTAVPDIDGTLIALMGIGQGAYIGKKILTKDETSAPRLNEISPTKGKLADQITVTGPNFGDDAGKYITINSKKVQFKKDPAGKDMVKWEDGKVTFKLFDIESISDGVLGEVLHEGGTVKIGIAAGEKSIVQDLPFEIEK